VTLAKFFVRDCASSQKKRHFKVVLFKNLSSIRGPLRVRNPFRTVFLEDDKISRLLKSGKKSSKKTSHHKNLPTLIWRPTRNQLHLLFTRSLFSLFFCATAKILESLFFFCFVLTFLLGLLFNFLRAPDVRLFAVHSKSAFPRVVNVCRTAV